MGFLERFLAAWMLVIIALAGMAVFGTIVLGFLMAWGWVLAHIPTWAEYILNFVIITSICATIIAGIDAAHDDER